MLILNTNQYNQGISKYKLLSSTAGVGSLLTTKMGYYILISDINKWKFVNTAESIINDVQMNVIDSNKQYDEATKRIVYEGISIVDDRRFIEFLRTEKDIANLLCLVGIPHLSLNDYNTVKTKNNPLFTLLKERGKMVSSEDFSVLATHFPKWFRNRKNELKMYSNWKSLWNEAGLKSKHFAPPKDAKDPLFGPNNKPKAISFKDSEGIEEKVGLFSNLSQINLLLICSNGHLSDIPWPRYLRWKTKNRNDDETGEKIFYAYDQCCPKPDLLWTESRTRSEGYGSIYLECRSCGMGSGKNGNPKVNLEGINNLKPFCQGHKPWEIDIMDPENNVIPFDPECVDQNGQRQTMQVTLATSNNVYYANGFSSLFIPNDLARSISVELNVALDICINRYNKLKGTKFEKSKEEWFADKIDAEFLIDNDIQVVDPLKFLEDLYRLFIGGTETVLEDTYEDYRWHEYRCFVENNKIDRPGLRFTDIALHNELSTYFKKIQQVEELKVSQVQLNFSRVRPNERIKVEGKISQTSECKNVFSNKKEDVHVLPAVENFGEGLFFQFNEEKISNWIYNDPARKLVFEKILVKVLGELNTNDQGFSQKQRIRNSGIKQFLIHSFSHMLMRELEFSCGYPTASLKERLYISPRMSGVLIYTAEGSEGSMGGLVWQGQTGKIKDLIYNGLRRSDNCSSDPLCWESDGQGLYGLNLAACFSCSLVSETACEEWNLGLDRRTLIDMNYGYFADILATNYVG